MYSEISHIPGTRICPRCHSRRVTTKDYAKTICGTTGFAIGATCGVAEALKGVRMGTIIGSVAGPLGMTFGGIAGAILGGVFGGITGGVAGAQAGSLIDTHLLQNCVCHECGLHFAQPSP